MENIEFDEEKNLRKTQNYNIHFKKPSIISKLIPRAKNKKEKNTLILLILIALILYGATFFVLFDNYKKEDAEVIDPKSLSPVEKFKLPEGIRMYIK